jgi:HprK-related kinase A
LILGDLGDGVAGQLASHQGLRLRAGPFTFCLQSSDPAVAKGLQLLYDQFPLVGSAEFIDFYVRVSRVPGIRRYLRPQVRFELDGRIPFKPLPFDQAFPLLEWGMNWSISAHAHQYLILHAAVLEKNGRALVMPAPPGSGKSTLCAALAFRGWRLLSDELTLIDRSSGAVIGLARPVSLKNASIDVIQAFLHNPVMTEAVHDTSKGSVAHLRAPEASVRKSQAVALPAWVVFPKFVADSPLKSHTTSKAQAFMRLADQAFNYSLLGAEGFELLAGIVDLCETYEFSYGDLDEAVGWFAALEVSP